jgi:hypothetical protein
MNSGGVHTEIVRAHSARQPLNQFEEIWLKRRWDQKWAPWARLHATVDRPFEWYARRHRELVLRCKAAGITWPRIKRNSLDDPFMPEWEMEVVFRLVIGRNTGGRRAANAGS